MSLQLSAQQDERVFSLAVCALPPTPYVVGMQYRFNGLTQGTLGAYEIVTSALSTTELDTNVTVITSTNESWRGKFDYSTCSLTWLRDNVNNSVASANIATFIWFSAAYTGNTIDATSIFTPTANITAFRNNTVIGGSSVVVTAVGALSITDSTFEGSTTLTINGAAPTVTIDNYLQSNLAVVTITSASSTVAFNNSAIINGSNVTIDTTRPFSLIRTTVTNFSILNVDGNINTILSEGTFDSANYTVQAAATGSGFLRFNEFGVRSNSSITISGTVEPMLQFRGVEINAHAALTISGTWGTDNEVAINDVQLTTGASLVMTGADDFGPFSVERILASNSSVLTYTGIGNVTDIFLDSGDLNNAGFNVAVAKVDGGATSTLVANILNASKTGYVNALP